MKRSALSDVERLQPDVERLRQSRANEVVTAREVAHRRINDIAVACESECAFEAEEKSTSLSRSSVLPEDSMEPTVNCNTF